MVGPVKSADHGLRFLKGAAPLFTVRTEAHVERIMARLNVSARMDLREACVKVAKQILIVMVTERVTRNQVNVVALMDILETLAKCLVRLSNLSLTTTLSYEK
ncbi:hypothetical protein LSAT2_032710 [Lamellibrachia satsuma]|nr:hypothetical protein LSAT2_032710 [Lamellibrachia satsuma]